MGLMTALADLISQVIFPWQHKEQSPKNQKEEAKSTVPASRLSNAPESVAVIQETGNFGTKAGLLSIQPIKMDSPT